MQHIPIHVAVVRQHPGIRVDREHLVFRHGIDITLRRRLRGIGVLSKKAAMDWCTVGPTSRGSGLPHDVRLTSYGGYGVDGIKLRPIYYEEGDCYARTMVRMDEVLQAVDLIRQALGLVRDGPFQVPVKGDPNGEAYGRVEAPRGESHHFVITGENNRPHRWRVRAPTYQNLQAVPMMIKDQQLADMTISLGSIDPCFSCTDRLETIDLKSGSTKVWSQRDLEKL